MQDSLLIAVALTISVACIIICIFNANDIKNYKRQVVDVSYHLKEAMTTGRINRKQLGEIESALNDVKKVYGDRLDLHRGEIDEQGIINTQFRAELNDNAKAILALATTTEVLVKFTTDQIEHNRKVIEIINELRYQYSEQRT